MRVFADTSFYLAIAARRDKWHDLANSYLRNYGVGIVTTEYVLFELGAAMARGMSRYQFVRIVEALRKDDETLIVSASPQLFEAGLALFASRPDKDWSLADCTSFIVMKQYGLEIALTSDRHFEQAGFSTLLK